MNSFKHISIFLTLLTTLIFLSACQITNLQQPHFELGPNMKIPRYGHSATLLKDGRVLIAGGYRGCPGGIGPCDSYVYQAEIYDPMTNKFSLTNKLKEKIGAKAFLLSNGQVALIGEQIQLFDPKAEKFILIGKMPYRMGGYTGTLLQDGKLLLTGGNIAKQGFNVVADA